MKHLLNNQAYSLASDLMQAKIYYHDQIDYEDEVLENSLLYYENLVLKLYEKINTQKQEFLVDEINLSFHFFSLDTSLKLSDVLKLNESARKDCLLDLEAILIKRNELNNTKSKAIQDLTKYIQNQTNTLHLLISEQQNQNQQIITSMYINHINQLINKLTQILDILGKLSSNLEQKMNLFYDNYENVVNFEKQYNLSFSESCYKVCKNLCKNFALSFSQMKNKICSIFF
ncbi:hypothetical protein AB837_00457 [bacterium AB1]|nr:hypothetical protein AB837_00457 [bacterium AB1]